MLSLSDPALAHNLSSAGGHEVAAARAGPCLGGADAQSWVLAAGKGSGHHLSTHPVWWAAAEGIRDTAQLWLLQGSRQESKVPVQGGTSTSWGTAEGAGGSPQPTLYPSLPMVDRNGTNSALVLSLAQHHWQEPVGSVLSWDAVGSL